MDIYSQEILDELRRRYSSEDIKSLSALYFVRNGGMPRVDFYNYYWRGYVLGHCLYKQSYLSDPIPEGFERPDYDYPEEYKSQDSGYANEYQIMSSHDGAFTDIVRMLLKDFEDMPMYLNCTTHIGKVALWRLKRCK